MPQNDPSHDPASHANGTDDRLIDAARREVERTITQRSQRLSEGPGTVIGRYKLLQRLGEGGFGVVYMAEQTEPVRRMVALKIIKLGMDTGQVIARFEAERQALAMMDHPNIAKVLDAGATDSGRPYFVMELVRGIPITAYCDQNNLNTPQRLDLFMAVCHAVQHAHQKGIIHRDIKPSNVMVTLHDGVPVPKVIDFGIAKATHQRLTEKTLFTQYGQFIGTPAYMSPEQAEMSGLDIDTRSDIYSLGVLLYELLTGTTPFDGRWLLSAGHNEMLRIIREQEPHKPSTRVSSLTGQKLDEPRTSVRADIQKQTSADTAEQPEEPRSSARADIQEQTSANTAAQPGDTPSESHRAENTNTRADARKQATTPPRKTARAEARGSSDARQPAGSSGTSAADIARHRRTDPASLSKQLRGDLDWIIMKALEKDRTRRYETANAFADDVRRHLDDQPVIAGPPSTAYRLSKFVRRNRTGVITAAAVMSLLLAGIAGTTWGLIRARKARDAESKQRQIAEAAERNQNRAREKAVKARDEADKQKHQARRQSYLASIRGAQASIQANDVHNAGDLLNQAPSEFRRWEWNYLHAQLDQSLAVLRGHEGSVSSVAFSPDGLRIVSGSGDKMVRLWDASSVEELAVLRGHESMVRSVAFSPDGSRIASGADVWDNTVRLWDAANGEQLLVLRGHESSVYSVAFSPDGARLASGSHDKTVRLWDATSGEQLRDLRGHESSVRSVVFSPDGSLIASGSDDKTVRLWDAASGEQLLVLRGAEDGFSSVAFSPDGSRIAAAEWGGTVRLWYASTGDEFLVLRGRGGGVYSIAFSPDGSWIALASPDKTVRLLDASDGEQLAVLRGHENDVNAVAFSPDGKRIVSGSRDNTVRLWDASIPDDFAVLRGHEDQVWSVAFSPDGSRIASGSPDRTVRLWDATSGKQLAVLRGHEGFVHSVAFSPDGSRIASGSRDKTVRLWDAASGKELAVFRGHDGFVNSVAFSPDGSRIASGSSDKTVRLWDAASGENLLVLRGHKERVASVTFSPDGSRIASGSATYVSGENGSVRVWDSASGDELLVLRTNVESVNSIAFCPDGSRIATCSYDKTVRLWDVASGEELLVLRGHQDLVSALAFSPDGSRIVSGSYDHTVRLWDASTSDELLVLREPLETIESVAFSPDGSRIASGLWYKMGKVRLWDTIAYRDRVAERDDARRAEQTMSRFVDELFNKGLDCSAVADRVKADASLSDPLRHAAINLVLKRCSSIHEQARSLIDDLEGGLIFAADIQTAVKENTSLEPAVHAAAANIARWIGDSPSRLSLVAWRIVGDDDRSQADYERAQRAAASALLQADLANWPQSDLARWASAWSLAKAWTRLHQPDKAVEVWREHIDTLRTVTPVANLGLTNILHEYGNALLKNDQAADAEPVLRECLSIFPSDRDQARSDGSKDEEINEIRHLLAECLTKQARFTEAEAILVEMADAALRDATVSKDEKTKAIQRVVDFYETWHAAEPDADLDSTGGTPVPQKAAAWRAKLPTATSQPAASQPATQPTASQPTPPQPASRPR